MILLDTNVISEAMRPAPDASITQWIDTQPLDTLYLSTITVAELRSGVALLPAGKRRDALHKSLELRILPQFAGRILPFDFVCTSAYAKVLATARKSGSGIETADALIAAVAIANALSIATRDTSPFLAAGATVINPWKNT